MSAIAVITARGGSKRIPGKNKKEFLGKPIICYSIEAALHHKSKTARNHGTSAPNPGNASWHFPDSNRPACRFSPPSPVGAEKRNVPQALPRKHCFLSIGGRLPLALRKQGRMR